MSGESGIAGDCKEKRAIDEATIEGDGGGADGGIEDLQECCDGVAGPSQPAKFFGGDIDICGGAPSGDIDAAGGVLLLRYLEDVEWCGVAMQNFVCCVADGLQAVLECECVAGSGGDDGDGYLGGCGTLHQTIDDFVDGAVTTDGSDAVEVLQFGCGGDVCGVSRAAGGDDGQLAAGLLQGRLQRVGSLQSELQAAAGVDYGQNVVTFHSCGCCLLC